MARRSTRLWTVSDRDDLGDMQPGQEYGHRPPGESAKPLTHVRLVRLDGRNHCVVEYLDGPRRGTTQRTPRNQLRVRWENRQSVIDDDAEAVRLFRTASAQWRALGGSLALETALGLVFGVFPDASFQYHVAHLPPAALPVIRVHIPALDLTLALGSAGYIDRSGIAHLPPAESIGLAKTITAAIPETMHEAISVHQKAIMRTRSRLTRLLGPECEERCRERENTAAEAHRILLAWTNPTEGTAPRVAQARAAIERAIHQIRESDRGTHNLAPVVLELEQALWLL